MKKKASSSETAPLKGVRVLVGRARHQAGALSVELRKLEAQVLEIPFIEIRKPRSIRPLDFALKNIASYDWLILTSVNGVEAMWERMARLRIPRRHFEHPHIAAIGPATKKAIEDHGGKVAIVPKEYVAESVVRSLKSKVKGKRVLLVRAKIARDVIPRQLCKAGAHVDVVEAYETVVPKASRARLLSVLSNSAERPHVVTFTSSSTVKNFVALLGKTRGAPNGSRARGPSAYKSLAGIHFASIGPVTSSTLREFGLPVHVEAKEFTIPGLVRAIAASRQPVRHRH